MQKGYTKHMKTATERLQLIAAAKNIKTITFIKDGREITEEVSAHIEGKNVVIGSHIFGEIKHIELPTFRAANITDLNGEIYTICWGA